MSTNLMGCLLISILLGSMISNISTTAYAYPPHSVFGATDDLSDSFTDENGVTYRDGGKTIVDIAKNQKEIVLSNKVEEIIPNLHGKIISFADDFAFERKSNFFFYKISDADINYDKVIYVNYGKTLAYIPKGQKEIVLPNSVEEIIPNLKGIKVILNSDFPFEEKNEVLFFDLNIAEVNYDKVVYINDGKTLAYIPKEQKEVVLSNSVENILPDIEGKTIILDSDFSLEGKSESLLQDLKNADDVEFRGEPIESLATNYSKNKKFIDLLPTDEDGLKPYLNIKINKHASGSDKKHYKNLSTDDYLNIKKQVILILNERFGTGISEEEISQASKEHSDKLIQKFDNFSRKDKAKAVYDWITENISYNMAQTSFEKNGRYEKNFAATVFNTKTGICLGFAQLSKVMMRIAGVPCFYCGGDEHAYNFICIEDDDNKEKMVWGLMDSCYGSYKVMNAELDNQVQEKSQNRDEESIKSQELYGKVTADGERSDNYFPMDKILREQIPNDSISHEVQHFMLKSSGAPDETANFTIYTDTKKINVSGNQSDELTIPATLQDLDGYELSLPKNIKTLNLGNSKFSDIYGLYNLEKVTVSESNTKYKDDNGAIVDKDTGKLIFSRYFKDYGDTIYIESCDDSGNVTIPECLQNRDCRLSIYDVNIKELNLGKSKFSEISNVENVEKVTVSESNTKYKNDNGNIVDMETGEIIFYKKDV